MQIQRKRNSWYSARSAALLLIIALIGPMIVQACTPSSRAIVDDGREATVGVRVGELAPDFTLNDLEGNPVSLSDLRGKVVFINFWATWCPPCRAEMPEIEAIHQEYQYQDVVVIGVDIRESEGDVRQYIQQGGFTWTIVLDSTGEVAANYQVTAIPTSYFIDRDGIIRAVNIGAMTKRQMEAKLTEAIR